MKVDLIATGGGRYRVMRDGVEVSAHTTQHTAFARGIAEKQITPGALIEVVTDFRVRVEITGQAVEPAPVDPVVPDPDPVDPVDPEPEPEPEPEPVDPPVILPPYTGDSLLMEQASTMQPGEWRNIAHLTTWPGKDEGRSFKQFQTVSFGTSSADGMGWTQNLVYHDGELMCILGRDTSLAALMHMDAQGVFSRHEDVWGGKFVGRRPFNRLTQDDEYLYFAPKDSKTLMGYFMRAPLDNPSAFERYGVSIGDDQMDSVGNFAMTYVPEWGRFYAYTPGGKIWSWTHGEAAWIRHERMPRDDSGLQLSGYAGLLLWNPIKKELAIVGGQSFGTSADGSHKTYRLTDPLGPIEMCEDRRFPDGTLMPWGSGSSRMLVHPHDGSYIVVKDSRFWWNNELGGTYSLYEDATVSLPFGPYENYATVALIPGTDVFAIISHIRGLLLHRVKPVSSIGQTPDPVEPEPQDPVDPDPVDPEPDPQPEPPPAPPPSGELAGSSLQIKADALAPGEWASALGISTFAGVWTKGALNSNSSDFWMTVAVWNPVQARMYGVLDRTAGGNVVESVVIPYYDAASDTWGNVPIPQLGGKFGSPHVYGRWALDVRRQKMYRRTQGEAWELDLASHVWTNTGPRNSAWGDGIAMHEGTGELMYMDEIGRVMAWNPDTNIVRTLGQNPAAKARHSHGHYNATRDEVCFAFGDGGNVMTLVSVDGSVRAVEVPIEVREGTGSASTFTFYDPASGHYLVYSGPRKLWEFDPDSGAWAMALDFIGSDVAWPPYDGHLIAPIPELGVVMWLHRSTYGGDGRHQRIYKHKGAL